MGAIASGGIRVLNDSVVELLELTEADIAPVEAEERRELERREREYRAGRPPLDVGARSRSWSMMASRPVRRCGPRCGRCGHWTRRRIVVAVPVEARETCEEFEEEADEAICAREPEPFHAVGVWYDDFAQTSDEEVRDLLARGAVARTAL